MCETGKLRLDRMEPEASFFCQTKTPSGGGGALRVRQTHPRKLDAWVPAPRVDLLVVQYEPTLARACENSMHFSHRPLGQVHLDVHLIDGEPAGGAEVPQIIQAVVLSAFNVRFEH